MEELVLTAQERGNGDFVNGPRLCWSVLKGWWATSLGLASSSASLFFACDLFWRTDAARLQEGTDRSAGKIQAGQVQAEPREYHIPEQG